MQTPLDRPVEGRLRSRVMSTAATRQSGLLADDP
jgi:hypothetical protein